MIQSQLTEIEILKLRLHQAQAALKHEVMSRKAAEEHVVKLLEVIEKLTPPKAPENE